MSKAQQASQARRLHARDISVRTVFFTIICLAVYQTATSTFSSFDDASTPCHLDHPDGSPAAITYPGESIAWTPCGTLASRQLECANLTVPMDHFNATNNLDPSSPPGSSNRKHFIIPLLRLRSNSTSAAAGGHHPTPNILLNPGGPGGSGTQFLHRRGAHLATILGPDFHLVGFDPRGVNRSVPLASCYPASSAAAALSRIGSTKRLPEDSGALWAWAGNFARACQDTMGDHGAYINTPQTAADMNAILDALGQRGLYYWGFSYGTILGQTYATMFPDRVERVVIDGVANQWDWYEERLDNETLADTDNVFEGFLDECVKAGEGACALAGLAESKDELREVVLQGVGALRDDPVGVYLNNTVNGVLGFSSVWYNGVFPALYQPASWGELAENLAKLIRGNATDAYLAYGQGGPWSTELDPLYVVSLNDGASGPDNWPLDRTGLLDLVVPFFNQSLFSKEMYEFYFAKRAWAIPRTHNYAPRRKVKTAHPLLLLSTTYDPVCPLVSARSASEAFEGSRIVEVKGYGHCSPAVPSTCLARHVRAFFQQGKLPEGNVQCEVDGEPYFAKPGEETRLLDALSLSEEERQIRLAQLELARDSWLVGKPW
ncbi:hypothetical protein VTK26DRAFT_8325 [Humicola hyalothermophila]